MASHAWGQAAPVPPSPIQFLEGHTSPVHAVGYSPDGKIIFSADTEGVLKMWDRVTGLLLSSGQWHNGAIMTLAVSPDGQQVATAGTGKQIVLSDVAIPRPLLDLAGVPGIPSALSMSPDGTVLLTGDESNTVSLWDPVAGKLIRNYAGATAPLVGVGFFPTTRSVMGASADGSLREWNIDNAQLGPGVVYTHLSSSMDVPNLGTQLVLGGQDGAIRLVNWPPKPPQNLSGHSDVVPAVAVSGDNRLVISGGYDQIVQISQLVDGQPLRTLSGQVGRVFAVGLSHDGAWAASGSEPGTIQLWKTADGMIGPLLAGHTGAVNDLSFHPEKPLVLSAGLDGTIRLWDIPRPTTPVPGHSQAVTAVAVSPNAELLATGSLDKTVRVSTVADGQPKFAINDFPQPIQSMGISSKGSVLGVGDIVGDVWVRSMANGATLSTWGGHIGGVTSMQFLDDGSRLVSSGADGTAKIWNLPLPTPTIVKAHEQSITAMAVTQDGKKIVTAGLDETIRIYNLENQQQVGTWKGTIGPLTALAISADDKLLVIGSSTGKWQSWSFPDAVEKQQQMGHDGGIHSVAIHPQSGELATAGADGTVKLWKGTEPPRVLSGHAGAVLAVTFTPDGASVISGGADASVRRWNVSDGVQALAYAGHQGQVTGVKVSADSTTLVTSSLDKTVRIWTVASGEVKVLTQVSPIIASDYLSDAKRITTTGEDLIVRIWDMTTGRELQRFPASKAALKAVRLTGIPAAGFVTGGADGNLTFGAISAEAIMLGDEVKVHDVAVTPDGTHIVTCGEDKSAKLWNLKGELVRAFAGSTTALKFVAVRGDGTQVASGGDPLFSQPNVIIWNLADGAAVRTLTAPAAVMGLSATSDGHWLVSCADKKLRVYSGEDGTLLEELISPVVLGETAVAPDRPLIISAGVDNNGYILNRSLKTVFKGHTGSVASVQWTPDGNRFLTAGLDQSMRLWSMATGKELATYSGVNSPINSLVVTGDGKKVAAATDDKRLLVWELPAANVEAPVQPPPPILTITGLMNLRGVATNQTGSVWGTAGDDGAVYLWDGLTGKLKERLIGHTAAAHAVAFSADGTTVISGSTDKTVKRWSPAVAAMAIVGDKPVTQTRFSPDGKSFFTSDNGLLVQRWSVETMTSDKQWSASAPVRSMNLSVDGQYLAVGCENQKVHVWNVAEGTETTWDCPVPITAVAVAHGGRKLIVSGNDHIVRVCGLVTANGQSTWNLTQTASGHTDLIVGLTLPMDDRQLFTLSKDRTVKRWLAASSVPRQSFAVPTGIIYGADFSPDGKLLATAGSDRKIHIWEVASGEVLATCEGHTAAVKSVMFNKQVKMLASGSLDGTIRFWDLTGQQTQMIADPDMKGINTVSISPNGVFVTGAGLRGGWNTWNRENLMLSTSGIGHTQSIVQISVSLAGNRMATIDESAHLSLWDANNGQLRYHVQLPLTAGYAAAYAPDNLEVLVGGNDNRLIRFAIPPYGQ
ncbi:MAG: WD40 repeat domain-containing protein [Planctomycetaceae bacterium]